jgi:hypothetical protein
MGRCGWLKQPEHPLESIDYARLAEAYTKARWEWGQEWPKSNAVPDESRIRAAIKTLAADVSDESNLCSGGIAVHKRAGVVTVQFDKKLEHYYAGGE